MSDVEDRARHQSTGNYNAMRFHVYSMPKVALAVVAMYSQANSAQAVDCHDLVGKDFGNAHVVETEDIKSPFSIRSSDPYTPGGAVTVIAPFCRVQAVISPTVDSQIKVEMWLPPAASWNGKYESVGNGGFAGIIIYRPMVWALEAGYAVASTDTGHVAEMPDSRWGLGHPEKITDLGWRSVHETAIASKALAEAYYGKQPVHSYFSGCSTGGREGLIEAQRFPKDYDGIVVGAPANYWPQMLAKIVADVQDINAKPDNWVNPAKLELVNKTSIAQCHGANGVLDDPGQCHVKLSVLLCKKGPSDDCLTVPETRAVQRLYDDFKDANGQLVYPGLSPGDESIWAHTFGPSGNRGVGGAGPYGIGFYRNLVFGKADWDWHDFRLEQDLPQALASDAGKAVYAENPDLEAFKAAGGKLLHYHGWNDPGIAAKASIAYYNSVLDKLGGRANTDAFYRLFLGTGMEHCGSGPGPNAVGGVFGSESPTKDAEHDLVSALAHWVEDGIPPSHIVATLYKGNDPSKGVAAQRPWCAYPAVARYDGKGDRSMAASYSCTVQAK